MTARRAPFFPLTATGDGTTLRYTLDFRFLENEDLRVIKNGVLQTLGTHYAIEVPDRDSGYPVIRFLTAPTNGHVIKFFRETPMSSRHREPEISPTKRIEYRLAEDNDKRIRLPYYINATDLSAGTAQTLIAPCDCYVEVLESDVVDAAISTGGALTVEIETVAVTGLSITVANSAAIGVHQSDTPTTAQSSTTIARKGQQITVTPAAAFNGGGALKGVVEIQPVYLG